jgi:hypothetical protein
MSGTRAFSGEAGDVGCGVSPAQVVVNGLCGLKGRDPDAARHYAHPDQFRLAVATSRKVFHAHMTSINARHHGRQVDPFTHIPSPSLVNTSSTRDALENNLLATLSLPLRDAWSSVSSAAGTLAALVKVSISRAAQLIDRISVLGIGCSSYVPFASGISNPNSAVRHLRLKAPAVQIPPISETAGVPPSVVHHCLGSCSKETGVTEIRTQVVGASPKFERVGASGYQRTVTPGGLVDDLSGGSRSLPSEPKANAVRSRRDRAERRPPFSRIHLGVQPCEEAYPADRVRQRGGLKQGTADGSRTPQSAEATGRRATVNRPPVRSLHRRAA